MKLLLFCVSLVSALPAVGSDVRVSLQDGTQKSGQLQALNDQVVQIQSEGQLQEIGAAEVLQLEFQGNVSGSAAVQTSGSQRVYLRDGSELSAGDIQRTANEIGLRSVTVGDLRIPAGVVSALRLQAEGPTFGEQWATFRQRESEKDLLIVVKRDGTGLDFLGGIVSSIGAESIEFLLDGEKVPVPSGRVYGVVFGRPAGEKAVVAGGARLAFSNGDVLRGSDLKIAAGRLQIVTTWGQSLECGVEQLLTADLSAERLSYLSDLPVLREALLAADPGGSLLDGLVDPETQQRLFSPRRDRVLQGSSRLRLRGREYQRGLCVHSHSVLSWALDGRFESLELTAGIDDEVAFNAAAGHSVRLVIRADDEVLLDRLISAHDQPVPLRLMVAGRSTLEVEVDFGDGSSVCDWLDLADAKLWLARQK